MQGVKGFYLGISTNVTRACVLNATKMGVYDIFKTAFKDFGFKDGLLMQFGCAFAAGFFMSCTVTPFDMVRTRVMNQPKDLLLYKGMVDCFTQVINKEGLMAVYKWFLPVWGRFAPATTLQLIIFEQLKNAQGLKTL